MGFINRFHLKGRQPALMIGLVFVTLSGILSAEVALPEDDDYTIGFSHAGAVDFDAGDGSLMVSDFAFSSLLSQPITGGGPLTIIPIFDCRANVLRFDDIPTSIIDDTPRSVSVYPVTINLSALLLSRSENSAWIHGIWMREQLASDLRDVGSEDFSTEIAVFSGYRFTDRFTFGAGMGVEHVDGRSIFHPGLGIDWMIHEELRMVVCGSKWFLSYTPDGNWEYSIRGDKTGEIWNMLDKGDETLALELASYRIGLFANRRLAEQIVLGVGVGATLGNEIDLRDSNNESIVKEGMRNGLFVQLELTIKAW